MTSFSFLPFATASPSSGLVALDFGPALLVVAALLLVSATVLAALAAPAPLSVTPSPRRATASRHVRRLGRSLGRRPQRRTLATTLARPRPV